MRRIDKLPVPAGRIKTTRQRLQNPGKPGWARDPKTGLWIRRTFSHNIIVLAGLSFILKSIQYGHADQGGSIRDMAVGTGYTTPTKSDTALEVEVISKLIDTWDNTDIDSDPPTMIATTMFLTTEANGELMEVGLFSADDDMLCRGLFGSGMIIGASKASPCVITSIGHELTAAEKIKITDVAGMIELNDNDYFVNPLTDDTFELFTDDDLTIPVDSSAYTDFVNASPNAAIWKTIVPKTTDEILTVNYTIQFPAD